MHPHSGLTNSRLKHCSFCFVIVVACGRPVACVRPRSDSNTCRARHRSHVEQAYTNLPFLRLNVNDDYNSGMGNVDKVDQGCNEYRCFECFECWSVCVCVLECHIKF